MRLLHLNEWKLNYFMLIYGLVCFYISEFIFYNNTKSEPVGYYFGYTTNLYYRGDLIIFCVNDINYLGIMHKLGLNYISNECNYNTPYLLKKIIAISGDFVSIDEGGIAINGKLYFNSRSLASFRNISLLPQKWHTFRLKQDEFFVLGDSSTSYDSRYFGIVRREQIKKRAILISFIY